MRLQGKKRLCIMLAVLNMCVATGAVDFDDEELGHWDRLGQSVVNRVGRVISKPTKASTDFIRRASERIIKPQHSKGPSTHDKDLSPTDTAPTTKQTPHVGHPTTPASIGEKLTHTIGEAVTHVQDAIKEQTAHTPPSTDTHTHAHTHTTPEASWLFSSSSSSSSSSTDQSVLSDSESHPLLDTLKSLVSSSSSSSDGDDKSPSSSSSPSHTTSSSSDTHATGRSSVHHAQGGDHKDSGEDGDRGVIEDDTFAYALVHTLPPTLPMVAAALVAVLGVLSALLWPFKKGTVVEEIEELKEEVVSREVPTRGEKVVEDGTQNEHDRGLEKLVDSASAMDAAMDGDKKASAGNGNDGGHRSANDAEDAEGDVHHSAREEPILAHDKPQQVGDAIGDGEGSPTGATGADNDDDGNHHQHDQKAPSEGEEEERTDEHTSDHSTSTSTEGSSSSTSTNGQAAHGQEDGAADAHTHAHDHPTHTDPHDHTHTDSHADTREHTHAHANAHNEDGHHHHGQPRYASTPSPATTAPSDDEEDGHHHHHHHHQHDQEHDERVGGEEEEGNGRKHRPYRPVVDEDAESSKHAHEDGDHNDGHHDQHLGPAAEDGPSHTHSGVTGGEGEEGEEREEEEQEEEGGLQEAPLQGYASYAHAVKATIPSEEDSHGDSDDMSARALSAALPSLS